MDHIRTAEFRGPLGQRLAARGPFYGGTSSTATIGSPCCRFHRSGLEFGGLPRGHAGLSGTDGGRVDTGSYRADGLARPASGRWDAHMASCGSPVVLPDDQYTFHRSMPSLGMVASKTWRYSRGTDSQRTLLGSIHKSSGSWVFVALDPYIQASSTSDFCLDERYTKSHRQRNFDVLRYGEKSRSRCLSKTFDSSSAVCSDSLRRACRKSRMGTLPYLDYTRLPVNLTSERGD